MSHSNLPAAIEIRVFWGDALHDVIELSPPRRFVVGDPSASGRPVDFAMPEVPGRTAEQTALVDVVDGEVRLCFPHGSSVVRRTLDADGTTRREPVLESLPLLGKESVDVTVGVVRFSVRSAGREERIPRAILEDRDPKPLLFFAASALGHGVLVASLYGFTPPLGLTDDEAIDKDRLYLMQQYLDASAEEEKKIDPGATEATAGGADAPEDPASGEAGKMGRTDLPSLRRRASGSEAGENVRPATSREDVLSEAATFGMIGLLSSAADMATRASWNDLGVGPSTAVGEMFGDSIGDSGGMGGLTLLGIGEGGGFRGESFGLRSIGTCQGSACLPGAGQGGQRRGEHVASGPRLRPGVTEVLSGSLPREVIQRVVRQSFGRFRGCYENGLRQNPGLEGRVTARFVIGRDGGVSVVRSGGSDLPDASVVSCILRAYTALSFPPPKDGIVTVSYPLTFSPSA